MGDKKTIIKRAIETGKVLSGTRSVMKNIKKQKLKVIILSSNCPKKIEESIKRIAGDIPLHFYDGTSLELGEVCGKPFPIAALAIISPGQANINELLK